MYRGMWKNRGLGIGPRGIGAMSYSIKYQGSKDVS